MCGGGGDAQTAARPTCSTDQCAQTGTAPQRPSLLTPRTTQPPALYSNGRRPPQRPGAWQQGIQKQAHRACSNTQSGQTQTTRTLLRGDKKQGRPSSPPPPPPPRSPSMVTKRRKYLALGGVHITLIPHNRNHTILDGARAQPVKPVRDLIERLLLCKPAANTHTREGVRATIH